MTCSSLIKEPFARLRHLESSFQIRIGHAFVIVRHHTFNILDHHLLIYFAAFSCELTSFLERVLWNSELFRLRTLRIYIVLLLCICLLIPFSIFLIFTFFLLLFSLFLRLRYLMLRSFPLAWSWAHVLWLRLVIIIVTGFRSLLNFFGSERWQIGWALRSTFSAELRTRNINSRTAGTPCNGCRSHML